LATGFHPADDSLVALDNEDVDALLIGDERTLRYHDLILRLASLDPNTHKLTVGQAALGIRNRPAHKHGISFAINLHVDEIDFAYLVIARTVGKTEPNLEGFEIQIEPAAGLLRLQKISLTHRKRHVHRILTDDKGQYPVVWADDIAFRDVGSTDLAGNGRSNLCISK